MMMVIVMAMMMTKVSLINEDKYERPYVYIFYIYATKSLTGTCRDGKKEHPWQTDLGQRDKGEVGGVCVFGSLRLTSR